MIGSAGEDKVRAQINQEGHNILGEQDYVAVPMPDGKMKVRIMDFVIRDLQGIEVVEAKANGAARSRRQQDIDAQFERTGGIVLGSVGKHQGLASGSNLGPARVHEYNVIVTPPSINLAPR